MNTVQRGKRRKIAAIILLITCAGAGGFIFLLKKADVHHSPERRTWKNSAILAIEADLNDPSIYRVESGMLIRPASEFLSTEGMWLTSKAIAFMDNSWMVYRQQCHKADPKVYDIFVGRGSDGKWYYSDAHFCIGAMVLDMRGQPESIAAFRKTFQLMDFDGRSDEALESTRH